MIRNMKLTRYTIPNAERRAKLRTQRSESYSDHVGVERHLVAVGSGTWSACIPGMAARGVAGCDELHGE